MEEKTLLTVRKNDKGGVEIALNPAKQNEMVAALSNQIAYQFFKKNQGPLNLLLSVVVNTLAQDTSGGLEKQFIDNVKKFTPEFRQRYKATADALKAALKAKQGNGDNPNGKSVS